MWTYRLMRSVVALFLVSLAAAAVRGQEVDMQGPRLEIESYRLPNGLKVALHRDASVPRVVVCVAYHVGSKNERRPHGVRSFLRAHDVPRHEKCPQL